MVKSLALPPRLALLALLVGLAASAISAMFVEAGRLPASVGLSIALSWAAFTDLDRYILPNPINFGLIGVGLVLNASWGGDQFFASAIGAVVGYVAITLLGLCYSKFRGRAGIGQGDAKLFSAAGAWLGWSLLPFVMVVASTAALAVVGAGAVAGSSLRGDQRIAFGPPLAVGFWIAWTFQSQIWGFLLS